MTTHPLLTGARLVLGVLTWAAILTQFNRHLGAGFSAVNFASYFTILSNGIAGIVLLVGAYFGVSKKHPPAWFDRARGAAALYMAVVGLVFVTLLRNVDLGSLLPWINTVHHYVMPVAVVAEWLIVPPARPPTTRDMLAFFTFPLAYVTYSLLRGASIGWYPYPFFNPTVVGGYSTVAIYVVCMFATFVAVAFGLRWTAIRAQDRRSR